MGGFQPWHILVIALVGAFLFFGWKNLPDMARSFGRSLRVFKTEIKGMNEDDSAREKAHDAKASAEPKQLEPRPAPVQRAEVIPPSTAPSSAPRATVGARPRPTPNPNGRPRA